jgi:hypothetical protein
MLTSRLRRPLKRSTNTVRDARLIVIASEGRKTEEIYFSTFDDARIKVIVLPCDDDRSAPNYILERALAYKKKFEMAGEDELWLAIDVDRWKTAQLAAVAKTCRESGIELAVSNPCFEIWLALHFDDELPNPANSRTLKRYLKLQIPGYKSAGFDVAKVREGTNDACERARILDLNLDARWPTTLGSRIYRLVASICRLNALKA